MCTALCLICLAGSLGDEPTVTSAYSPDAGKRAPAVQHSPIIEDYGMHVSGTPQKKQCDTLDALTQDVTWLELEPVLN